MHDLAGSALSRDLLDERREHRTLLIVNPHQ